MRRKKIARIGFNRLRDVLEIIRDAARGGGWWRHALRWLQSKDKPPRGVIKTSLPCMLLKGLIQLPIIRVFSGKVHLGSDGKIKRCLMTLDADVIGRCGNVNYIRWVSNAITKRKHIKCCGTVNPLPSLSGHISNRLRQREVWPPHTNQHRYRDT